MCQKLELEGATYGNPAEGFVHKTQCPKNSSVLKVGAP
jgi:hypothetical protein